MADDRPDSVTTTTPPLTVGDEILQTTINGVYPTRAWSLISMDAPGDDGADVTLGMVARRGLSLRSALELSVMLLESQGFTVIAPEDITSDTDLAELRRLAAATERDRVPRWYDWQRLGEGPVTDPADAAFIAAATPARVLGLIADLEATVEAATDESPS